VSKVASQGVSGGGNLWKRKLGSGEKWTNTSEEETQKGVHYGAQVRGACKNGKRVLAGTYNKEYRTGIP